MTRYQLLERLYHEVAEAPESERGALLRERCAGDEKLRAEVEELLTDAGERVDLAAADVVELIDQTERVPTAIGPFKIVRLIGEGGMGRVYEAEQAEPRRRVALKVIRPGLMSRAGLRRFRHEADVLASLKHPGIAQILQAGSVTTPDSLGVGATQPYIAMELVRGPALTEYARRRKLGPREKLGLLALICDAVQHAHQRGVIHRDLKPANILVEESDGSGGSVNKTTWVRESTLGGARSAAAPRSVDPAHPGPVIPLIPRPARPPIPIPKILDFGIARLAAGDDKTTAVSIGTQVGQIVGTLAYMSPEQIDGDPQLLDTRADVYALGVIAYELLGGRLPLEIGSKSVPAAVMMIREQEPERLGSLDVSLRGDVETIIQKAMEKDRDRRYASAGELAADIRRWANNEPIAARPASALYQVGKFAKRNRLLVGAAVLVVAALAVGATVATVSAVSESRARRRADAAAHRANLSAALADLKGGNARSARSRLLGARPEQRGWEWRYLSRQCDSAVATLPIATGTVAAILPRSATDSIDEPPPLLVLLPEGGPSRVWRAGQSPVPAFECGKVPSFAAASPDGRLLLVQSGGGERGATVRALSLEGMSGRELWRREDVGVMSPGAIDRTGSMVVLEAGDDEVVLVEAWTGRELRRLPVRNASSKQPRFAPSESDPSAQLLLVNSSFMTLMLDPDDGHEIRRLPMVEAELIEEGQVAVGWRQSDLARLDLARGEQRSVDVIGPGRVSTADPTGRWAIVADVSNSLRLRDMESGGRDWLHGHTDLTGRVTITGDGRWALTENITQLKWWDLNAVGDSRSVPRTYDAIASSMSDDGTRMVTLGWGSVRMWDTQRGQIVWSRMAGSRDGAASGAFSPDGRRVMVAGWEGVGAVYDVETGELEWRRPLPGSSVRALAWSGDGNLILIGDVEGRLRTLSSRDGAERSVEEAARPLLAIARVPALGKAGGDRMVTIIGSGGPGVPTELVESPWCTLKDSRTLAQLPAGDARSGCIAASPDGRWVVAGRMPDDAMLVDRQGWTGKVGRTGGTWNIAEQIGVGVSGAAFHPGSSRLALLCADGLVRLVDPGVREETLSLAPACGGLGSVWFGADQLIVGGTGMAMVVYDAAPRAATLAQWRLAQRARSLTDPLFDELRFSDKARARVESMPGLDPALRAAAIATARGRGDQYNQVNSFSWEIVRFPGRRADEVQLAVEAAELCCRGSPDRFGYANTLGVALYRAGRHAEAITALRRSMELAAAIGRTPHPLDHAFIAMAAAKMGRGMRRKRRGTRCGRRRRGGRMRATRK